MPTSITQELNIDPRKFHQTGAFDAILDIDSKLFIHPELLKITKTPELKNAYKHVHNYFGDIMTLLVHCKNKNDRFWREAEKRLTFPELKGVCIGYAKRGTRGSGMGKVIREALLDTAKQIVDAGIKDPEIFELVGLFEENVGCDRISDMVGKIIEMELFKYSERIFKKFKVKGKPLKVNGKTRELPFNSFNNQAIILVPRDILDTLPEALSWDDIDVICSKNAALRRKINEIVGSEWAKRRMRIPKRELKDFLIRNPNVLRELIAAHKGKKSKPYDFLNDPSGEVSWYPIANYFASTYPLYLSLAASPNIEDVYKIANTICGHFKEMVENKGLWKNLYSPKTKRPFTEPYAQRLFYMLADVYCKANGLDISPESDGGRGPVDFKLSRGYVERVLVELKLSTNKNLISGYEKQLPIYQKAESGAKGIYLVVDFGTSPERIKRLFEVKNKLANACGNLPEIILVDAMPKKSASKVK